ncbi:MAG: Ig-like domain-containing protein [Eubacterium sp.]|nr:Ig-like domain-containing protein [Eubacterium sp.]
MKKSFMTRVLAVSLSAAMAFSMSSASNLVTASAASTVNLKTTFKTLKVGQSYKMTLKNNTLNWKITKVTTTNKKICTVYGKTASSVMLKGKGVGRAKISIKVKTTKRKYPKNIKIMKCTANVKAAAPTEDTTAFSATAVANSNTEVRVNFSKAVDAVAQENFTVSDGVTVSKAELSEDKKSATLTIAGAEYGKNYDLTVTGVKVGGAAQADQKLTFTTPAAVVKYPMTLEAKDKILKSDGQSQTVVTFKITDANGTPVTDKGVEVAFATSLGKFAEQRVSIQNGEATVMYTSEALMETQTAAITATIVESTNNQELMGLSTSSSITLTPNPEALDDTSIGAIITSATAPTADRIIAYFNQKVEAKDFKTSSGRIDKSKFTCTVQSGIDNGFEWVNDKVSQSHNVVGILDVPGDENALQLLVDTPMVDNTNVKVEFENKTKTNNLVSAKNTVYFKLTDAHQPSVLNAVGEGYRKVKVEFSEAVLPNSLADAAANAFTGDNIENYLIDGKPLSSYGIKAAKAPGSEGEDGSNSKVKKYSSKKDEVNKAGDKDGSVQVGHYDKGDDKRNVVTIELGKDHYLLPGTHSLSVSNVGDWAANTDKERNIVNTQTFDFVVEANDVVPTFTVEEQSPEQWLLTFNSDVELVDDDDTLRTPDSYYSKASVLKLQQNVNGTWVDITDGDGVRGKNPIRVSQVDDTRQYVVEVKRDWTQVYTTTSTRENYFNQNLRLHIDAGKIVNVANNKQNSAIDINLDGTIMKTPDVVSPVIGEIVQAEDESGALTDSYNVTMSEPVKLTEAANAEGLTPSETQAAGATNNGRNGVPMPSAQFIRVDNGQTIDGIISEDAFIDATDTTINVAPESALSAGEWRLVMSSISDDYGNTAATVAETINVTTNAVTSNFKIVWAAVQKSNGAGTALLDDIEYDQNRIGKDKGRYIFVKFNKPVTMTGNSMNAGVTGNYTINGATLPTGTQIRANIKGYDDHDGVTDSITIILPEGSYTNPQSYDVDAQNAMLNVSRAITSTTGETLSNGGLIRIPFQYGAGNTSAPDYIGSLNTKTDAVWGNDSSEKRTGFDSAKKYYQALKNALEDDKYRRVELSSNLELNFKSDEDLISVFGRSGALNINRAVDIELNGSKIIGNVVVSTSDAVDKMSIKSTGAQGGITGYSARPKEGAALTVNAGNIKAFNLDNVTVDPGENNKYALCINDVYSNSFHNINGSQILGDIILSDANGAGFENSATLGTNTNKINFTVTGKGDVNLRGDFNNIDRLVLQQTVKLTFSKAANLGGMLIEANTAATRIIFEPDTVANGAKVVAKSKDIRVTVPASLAGKVSFIEDQGEFVSVNANNKEVTGTSGDAVNIKASASGFEVKSGGIQDTLNKLDVLWTGDQLTKALPDTVSTGAITSGEGIKIDHLKAYIRKQEYKATDTDEPIQNVSVSYNLNSNNLVEIKNGTIVVKNKIEDTSKEDILSVVISYGGRTVRKEFRIFYE